MLVSDRQIIPTHAEHWDMPLIWAWWYQFKYHEGNLHSWLG